MSTRKPACELHDIDSDINVADCLVRLHTLATVALSALPFPFWDVPQLSLSRLIQADNDTCRVVTYWQPLTLSSTFIGQGADCPLVGSVDNGADSDHSHNELRRSKMKTENLVDENWLMCLMELLQINSLTTFTLTHHWHPQTVSIRRSGNMQHQQSLQPASSQQCTAINTATISGRYFI